jgi:OOP family OmpA-OmpF porin
MFHRALSLCALLLGLAVPLTAQSPGTVGIGAFGRSTWFDDSLGLDQAFGGGGTLGFFLFPNFALEAEAAYTSTSDTLSRDVSNIPLRGRLTYNLPLGGYASAIRLGAGYVRDLYRKDVDFDDDGITGLVGLRFGLSRGFALQVDGTLDYVPKSDQRRADDYVNWGVQAGVVLLLGNRLDRDKDGVEDRTDRCPGTPAGESVDQSGCSASQRDTDSDGVKDAADRCPGTTGGETVDAEGCAPSQKDADADNVVDSQDKCPRTPAGETADKSGCSPSQRDSDADGVKDNADRCPDTAAGAQVNGEGCATSQLDADGDGVTDDADRCPNTPRGDKVDASGCSLDTDADGVPDSRDRCPNTPNGQAVDGNGCPKLPEAQQRSVILKGVNFATGKSELTDSAKLVLTDVAQSLAANPDVRVQVGGYTDNTGSRATNMRLSKARAQAVEEFLQQNGASPAQVTSRGYGPAQPVASNRTEAGRAQNRRVALILIE